MATDEYTPTEEQREEERRARKDRRGEQIVIPFPDRRSGKDRREDGGEND